MKPSNIGELQMIKSIKKLSNCGIFRNFKWDNSVPEFGKYNLLYGLNGSGKSTLSQALSFFSAQTYDKSLGEYDIEIVESSGTNIGNRIHAKKLTNPIYVFNKDFIQRNIESEGKLDEIVYLSEENIEAKEQIKEYNKEIEKLKAKKEITEKTYNRKKKDFEKIAPQIAANVKKVFVEIGGLAAQTYANFNKRGVEEYFHTNKVLNDEQYSNCDIEEEIKSLKKALEEKVIPPVEVKIDKVDLYLLNRAIQNALNLLKKDVNKKVALEYSNEILNWIEKGLPFHKVEDKCKFCGNIITSERMFILQNLFNDEHKSFITKLELSIKELESLVIPLFEDTITIYNEYNSDLEIAVSSLNKYCHKLNKYLALLAQQLINKKSNVNLMKFEKIDYDCNWVNLINSKIKEIENYIDKTNDRTKDFTNKQKEKIETLKNILLYRQIKELKYTELLDELNQYAKEDKDIESKIQITTNRKTEIESTIQDVLLAAREFNSLLHQFLGRKEISLIFDKSIKGYKIVRGERKVKAERLSEGEKTAISFIYFLIKIQENGNMIENTIIVLDDPISSLDSNNIFNAYAFMFAMFENCHQLFVFTHNFTLFSLLKRKIGKELKKDNNLYLIENTHEKISNTKVREAKIIKLPSTLKELNSDYAFNFKCVKKIIDEKNIITDINEYFFLANNCRKILETFCSFKLINMANFNLDTVRHLYKMNNSEDYSLTAKELIESEKIFRFINYYSHGNKFSIASEVDIIIGEALTIAENILGLIKRTDPIHYGQLIQVVLR